MSEPPRTIELTDARALRALAHPVRLKLVGVLRREGPLTATQAGELIGETATTCSFHLRQLARYGLVEEAGGGKGRARPWRATAWFTSWPGYARDEETAAATALLSAVVVDRYVERIHAWLERRAQDAPEWQEASHLGDTSVYVTAKELAELGRAIDELVEPFVARVRDPSLRPESSRLVELIRLAFPAER